MTDFTLFDKDIKLCWVKCLCSTEHSPWKIIPSTLLSNVGGTLLFRCNYDVKFLKLSDPLPTFYKNIIAYWQELITPMFQIIKKRYPIKLSGITDS